MRIHCNTLLTAVLLFSGAASSPALAEAPMVKTQAPGYYTWVPLNYAGLK